MELIQLSLNLSFKFEFQFQFPAGSKIGCFLRKQCQKHPLLLPAVSRNSNSSSKLVLELSRTGSTWIIYTFIYLKEKSSTKVNRHLGIPLDHPRRFTKTCYSTETSPRQFSFIWEFNKRTLTTSTTWVSIICSVTLRGRAEFFNGLSLLL